MRKTIKTKIFITTETLLYIIVTVTIILTAMWIEPAATFKYALRIIIPFLLITYFFLFLVFRIISFYYFSLLQQKNLIELLNSGLRRLETHIKTDAILRESLDIFLNFYGGDRGVILITDNRIKEYNSQDIITVNISKENKLTDELNKTYSILTFSPASISEEINKKIKQSLQEYDFGKCKGVIILPEEVNKASITDALTGLYNRRYFKKRVEQEFAKAKRAGFPISIMISDLDNFKYYVDSYGHPKGDQILLEVGYIIKNSVRESDVVCRFGGDEFAYLLPFTSSGEAKILAERIKKNVSKYT